MPRTTVKSHGLGRSRLRGHARPARRPPRKGTWKKRVNGRRSIRSLKKTKMGRTALQGALALKTLKKHEPPSQVTHNWETSLGGLGIQQQCSRTHCHLPYDLDRSSTRSESQRECDNIYMFNSRGEFEINPGIDCIDGFEIRMIQGWSKGIPDLTNQASAKTPVEGAQPAVLNTMLKTTEDKLNPDYYHVLKDKLYTFRPSLILPGRTVTRAASQAELASNYIMPVIESHAGHWIDHTLKTHNAPIPERAVWTPKRLRFNFHFNRKVMYDGASGTDAVGNIPFVAIQLYRIRGSKVEMHNALVPHHPEIIVAPSVTYDHHEFFKDC